MLCCKKLLKKLHILARKRPFQREIGCSCGISSPKNAKNIISALFCHGRWVFRGERCKKLSLDDFLFVWETNHMLTALTDEQRWNGNEFFALCEKFLHCVKSFFALCEEVFCTVWRGFAYFVSGLERASWPSGVSSLFQNNLQYPINILKTGLSDLHALNFKTLSYSLASA